MNPNVISVYSFLALLIVAGVVLSTVHWTLTGTYFLLALTHFMMFTVGRLVERPMMSPATREEVKKLTDLGKDVAPDAAEMRGRPESLAEKIKRRNRENKGVAQVLRMEGRNIPFNGVSTLHN